MPSNISLTFLSTTQQTNGYNILVTVDSVAGSSTQVAAFNTITFPAKNIEGFSNYTDNSFVNNTYSVGSQNCSLVSYSADKSIYTLNISTADTLPVNSDYYISVSATTTDGITTDYCNALLLPLSPSPVDLIAAVISRSANPTTQATISVLFNEPTSIPTDSTYTYNAATQILKGDGTYGFIVEEGLAYNTELGGVSYTINAGIDEAYIAIQVVRQLDDPSSPYGQLSTYSELSDTIEATDSGVPLYPDLKTLDYVPATQLVTLSWESNASDPLTDVTSYSVYYTLGSGTGIFLASVAYVPGTTTYSYMYNLSVGTAPGQIPPNALVTYYIESENANGHSIPSNTKSITVVVPSSAPLNLTATAIRDSANTQDVSVTFTKPTSINGSTINAYYVVKYSTQANPTATLASQNVPYDGSSVVIVPFNQTPYSGENYIVTAYLVTTDVNTNPVSELVGTPATASFTSGYAPFIYSINDDGPTGTWTRTIPLTSVQVLTAGTLTDSSMELTLFVPGEGQTIGIVRTETVDATAIQQFNDPYSSFEHSYMYTFDLSNISDTILSFTVANTSSLTTRHISGSLGPA